MTTTEHNALRQAVADYMRSEGCSCCRDIAAHAENERRLAKLLAASIDQQVVDAVKAKAAREWQAIAYGDHPETWAALAYYRERSWPVDENTWAARERVEGMIQAFKSGYRAALEAK